MSEARLGSEKARMVLDCFKEVGAKANEIVEQDRLLAAASGKNYSPSDIMDGILFGEAEGLFAHESTTAVKLTAAGYSTI